MVDPLIEELVADFIVTFINLHNKSNAETLDYSYDSLGHVDSFLRSLDSLGKLRGNLSILKGASAYIGLTAYEVLKKLNRTQTIKLTLRTLPIYEINLEIFSNKKEGSGADFRIPIFSALKLISETTSGSLKLFHELETPIYPNTRKFFLFCSGLISGLSPFNKGNWGENKIEHFAKELDQITSNIAIQVSGKNALRFPSSKLLADPNFYKYHLVLPPLGFDEEFPGIRATSVVSHALRDLTPSEVNRITLALLSSPDELKSSIGYILACATKDESLINLASSFATTFWPMAKNLRPAVLLARTLLKQDAHWLKLLGEKGKENSLEVLRRDQRLGLFPYLGAPAETNMLKQENLLFIDMLTLSQYKEASELSSIIKVREEIPSWLKYQIILLEASQANFNSLSSISDLLTPLAENNAYPYAWDLKTRIALILGNLEEAFSHIRAYFSLTLSEETFSQEKNLLNLFLQNLTDSKIEVTIKAYYIQELKNLVLQRDTLLTNESFFLINHITAKEEDQITIDSLSTITQTCLRNSPWSLFEKLH